MRLAIADPPYPPLVATGGTKQRASRWYGDQQRGVKDRPADVHADAVKWDDPAEHRGLLESLLDGYDGFAVATSADGLAVYHPLPLAARVLVWVKPNAQPGSHRIGSRWEAVILYPPVGRRSNRNGAGMVSDVLVCPQRGGFIGAKPPEWTTWVLDCLSYDAETDTVDDLFPGSGAVAAAVAQGRLV